MANAYRGELLGLMALHMILLAVNKVDPGLKGEITLHFDCLGAISRIEDLAPRKIPSACKHADILKNILIVCERLTFDMVLEHVEAHQNDGMEFHMLARAVQLNCAVDAGANRALSAAIEENVTRQQAFPLEPIVCFPGERKLTPDMKACMHFWVQKQLARKALLDLKIIWTSQFDKIDWKYVHATLEGVPRMFQIWACKQVLGIANTNNTVHKWDKEVDPRCPSCRQAVETMEHVLMCTEAGCVDIYLQTVGLLDAWFIKMDKALVLRAYIVDFC